MDLALNNLQRLICHKTQQTKPNQIFLFYLFNGISSFRGYLTQKQFFSNTSVKLFNPCNPGALGNADNPFNAIPHWSTLTRSG